MSRALGKMNKMQSLEYLNIFDQCRSLHFPQVGKLVAHFMPGVSHSDDSSFYALLVSDNITCQGISAPLTFGGKRKPSLPPRSTRSPENCSLKGHQKKPSSHVISVFWARNGLKPSGQQQKQRSWTSFHANDLSVASCLFTVLLSARAPGPSKPGARF